MTEGNDNTATVKRSALMRFLDRVERVGNKLPHPAILFAIFAFTIVIASWLISRAGITAVHPGTGETISAVNMLSGDGFRFMWTDMTKNFVHFPPLGVVLVAMIGIGVAEGSGLISALLRHLVTSAPPRMITAAVIAAGILSHLASSAGYVVLIPLGAMIFAAFKRHPIAGLAAAFLGVSGGFGANFLIGAIDPILAGLTESAAQIIDPEMHISPAVNYYFMLASACTIVILGTIVTEKIVEPRLGKYEGESEDFEKVSPNERKGLAWAAGSVALFLIVLAPLTLPGGNILQKLLAHSYFDSLLIGCAVIIVTFGIMRGIKAGSIWKGLIWVIAPLAVLSYVLVLLWLPHIAILRNPETGSLLRSPFMSGLITAIMIFFVIPGIAYGIAVGTIGSDKDIIKFMSTSMKGLSGYIIIVFFAAQFVYYFKYSNIGVLMAIRGAEFLGSIGFTGVMLLVAFVLLSAFINLFMGSASAKWAIMAPVFVPMFMLVGYHPGITQAAFRIGDSITNIITPMMSYFALIVAFAQKYDEKYGIGTITATMLPYTIIIGLVWTILLAAWMLIGLPVGPDAPIHLPG